MFAHVRVSIAAALLLWVACSAPAGAQQRACSAADSARVGWSPPPGVADEAWRATLLAGGLVAPGTALVRAEALHSLGGDFEQVGQLLSKLDNVIRARAGNGPATIVALMRVEPDSTLSRLVLALPSGMVGIEEAVGEPVRRVRFAPAVADGCPMVIWYPMTVEISPPQNIGAAGQGTREPAAPPRPPGNRWVGIEWNGGATEWIDTTSVSRTGENVFRFTLRNTYPEPRKRRSDGLAFDASEEVMEFDCTAMRSRTLRSRGLLGERVVGEETHDEDWTMPTPRLGDAYCPVLSRAASGAPRTPPNQ